MLEVEGDLDRKSFVNWISLDWVIDQRIFNRKM